MFRVWGFRSWGLFMMLITWFMFLWPSSLFLVILISVVAVGRSLVVVVGASLRSSSS